LDVPAETTGHCGRRADSPSDLLSLRRNKLSAKRPYDRQLQSDETGTVEDCSESKPVERRAKCIDPMQPLTKSGASAARLAVSVTATKPLQPSQRAAKHRAP